MEERKLKVGDVVYEANMVHVYRKHVIERVTKTLAFSGRNRFKININSSGRVSVPGEGLWKPTTYYIATPELDEKYFRRVVANQLEAIDFTTLPIEKVKQIAEAIKR